MDMLRCTTEPVAPRGSCSLLLPQHPDPEPLPGALQRNHPLPKPASLGQVGWALHCGSGINEPQSN